VARERKKKGAGEKEEIAIFDRKKGIWQH